MERYQIILAYDGTEFHGSQLQKDTRTVQVSVETALRKLGWSGKSILLAGRTDAGVHASGQVVAFDLNWNHSPVDLQNALNALLPKDIAVSRAAVSSPDFHPRYDATARSYRYRIFSQPVRDPLRERYAWRVWPAPDLAGLLSAAQLFLGTQDFAGFGRATQPGGSTIRQVMVSKWQDDRDEFVFEITANAFLYHMVRRMVFVQIEVNQGNLSLEDLHQHLQFPQAEPLPGLAPPQGLTLVEVLYSFEQGENN